jgi:predicted component of type VI protein secretion system
VWSYYLETRENRLRLSEGDTVIGRGDDCDFFIDDPTASRRHAVVRWEGDRFAVVDLGSSNGTFLNGVRVEGDRELLPDDRILIGETSIHFVVTAAASIEPISIPTQRPSLEPVAPGIDIIEQHSNRPQSRMTTEPQFSSVEVLECLVASPHAAEEPAELAVMIQSSIDRLITTSQRRGLELGDDVKARVVQIADSVRAWFPDRAYDAWAAQVRERLGL